MEDEADDEPADPISSSSDSEESDSVISKTSFAGRASFFAGRSFAAARACGPSAGVRASSEARGRRTSAGAGLGLRVGSFRAGTGGAGVESGGSFSPQIGRCAA